MKPRRARVVIVAVRTTWANGVNVAIDSPEQNKAGHRPSQRPGPAKHVRHFGHDEKHRDPDQDAAAERDRPPRLLREPGQKHSDRDSAESD